MKLMFTGDVNFRGIEELDAKKSFEILKEIMPWIRTADYVIPNLECPLAEKKHYLPIKKSGPNLISSEENICFLKAMNAYAVTLANNHIGDYGSDALTNTLNLLKEHQIRYAGAGTNLEEAYDEIRINDSKLSVSVLSVCENEFGIATERKAGSAGYRPGMLLKKITQEKQRSDFVIVVFHGGNEHNPLPSPDTVERYRLICDMGADAVVAGHTHCPQGYERYGQKPIIYSMGNFLFLNTEKTSENDPWYYGYATMLDVTKNGISMELIPYRFDPKGTKISVVQGDEKKTMEDYIARLSEIIQNGQELKQYFKGWSMNHIWIPKLPDDMEDLTDYPASGNYDLITCEAHLSQARQIFEILFCDEVTETKFWQKKILDLQKMPV